ncbi:hypothetical protein BC827DRAFT_1157586 [Russula dissimulans]|nr:hypothetical protein BC827DRAFT_1157586 [Russula dissimulans]
MKETELVDSKMGEGEGSGDGAINGTRDDTTDTMDGTLNTCLDTALDASLNSAGDCEADDEVECNGDVDMVNKKSQRWAHGNGISISLPLTASDFDSQYLMGLRHHLEVEHEADSGSEQPIAHTNGGHLPVVIFVVVLGDAFLSAWGDGVWLGEYQYNPTLVPAPLLTLLI